MAITKMIANETIGTQDRFMCDSGDGAETLPSVALVSDTHKPKTECENGYESQRTAPSHWGHSRPAKKLASRNLAIMEKQQSLCTNNRGLLCVVVIVIIATGDQL